MTDFWDGKRVLVTGGCGFIGQHVVDALVARGVAADDIVIPPHEEFDLAFLGDAQFVTNGCDVVLHLAAQTGGIAYSRAFPASQYYKCMRIDLSVMEAARLQGAKNLVAIGNILAYPMNAPSPLEEEMLYDGPVARTHLGIGTVKRELVTLCEMYYREHHFNALTVLSANAYGPGDRFDPAVAHVIPATIIKCHKDEPLVVWGDGSQTRDFLYVSDIADGLLDVAETLDAPPHHINLSGGQEVSIRELVETIARLCEFKGEIIYDDSKGGGDVRRVASGRRAKQFLNFSPKVNLEEGLRRTIEWYRSTIRKPGCCSDKEKCCD